MGPSWGGSSNSSNENNSGNGDDEEDDEFETIFHADHIMFLVDVRAPMLERNAAGRTHIEDTIGVIIHIMKQKTTARDNSAIGIIFLGTGKTTNNDQHYVEVLPLQVPSAVPIRNLQALLDNFEHEFQEQFGGSQEESMAYFPLKEALWRSTFSFAAKASSNKLHQNAKRVWVFSNDDDPNSKLKQHQIALEQVASDCAGNGTEISLWCIDRSPEQPFRVDQFYKGLLTSGADTAAAGTEGVVGGGEDGLGAAPNAEAEAEAEADLSERIMRAKATGFDCVSNRFKAKYHKKRVAHHGFMDLGLMNLGGAAPLPSTSSGIGIGIGNGNGGGGGGTNNPPCAPGRIGIQFFIDLKVAKKPSPMKLYSKNNEPVKSKVAYLCKDTGETVPDHEIRTFVAFGNESMPLVSMTKQEMLEVRAPVPRGTTLFQKTSKVVSPKSESEAKCAPSPTDGGGTSSTGSSSNDFCDIEVLYFAPTAQLRPELNIKEPLFIYPNEGGVQGSTVLFAALVQVLSQKNLIAMVRFNGHKAGAKEPRLAAMLPQPEELDEEGDQIAPPGFQLIVLPFRNEIRAGPQDVPASALAALDARSDLMEAAEEVVTALSVQRRQEQGQGNGEERELPVFDYQSVPCPALQQFHAVLQAVALRENEYSWTQADDRMIPDYSFHAQGKSAASVRKFREALGMPDDAGTIALGKRPTGGTGPNSLAAKKTRSEAVETETIKKILQHIANDVKEIKVDGLKDFCRLLELPLSGKRDDLIQRIITGAETMLRARGVSIQ